MFVCVCVCVDRYRGDKTVRKKRATDRKTHRHIQGETEILILIGDRVFHKQVQVSVWFTQKPRKYLSSWDYFSSPGSTTLRLPHAQTKITPHTWRYKVHSIYKRLSWSVGNGKVLRQWLLVLSPPSLNSSAVNDMHILVHFGALRTQQSYHIKSGVGKANKTHALLSISWCSCRYSFRKLPIDSALSLIKRHTGSWDVTCITALFQLSWNIPTEY